MRKMLLVGAAALTFTAIPSVLFAQDADGPTTTTVTTTEQVPVTSSTQKPYVMTVQQKTTYATWPADRQTSYQAWPIENQTYYWTLTPEQQAGYWALTPDQQGQIYKMSPEQRAIAWQSIQQQMAGQTPTTPEGQANPPGQGMPTAGVPNPQSAEQAARPAMPADPGYQGGPYKGALTPPPADAMNKSYPVCSKTVTDGCRNRGGK
ncbi:hypothetical protein [uncultured Novosphingobium sp.]|uniref:hypothetical protein n=1 Tax=uncultured Novosphingobium sp. TaxID=292277 RepID=UPI00258FC9AB|nr:hypothetical protein [uncultured Novosphingobium sp.]